MKRIFIAAFLLSTYFSNAQNSLLNSDFWKKSPDVALVKSEIQKGNSPSEANRGNHDVVSIAINNNAPLETILYLLDQPGNSVDKITHDGRLYIHWAASRGNVELLKILIDRGSDIFRTDDKGALPISFAASNGQKNIEIYELLFDAGNDPKQKFQKGANLLLLSIAHDKDLTLANYFTSKGLSLNSTDDIGATAFDYAAQRGDVEFLQTLVDKGVKPTNKSLIFASQGARGFANTLETYQFLVDKLNINPKAKGDNGENVLHNLVKKQNQEEIIIYFIEKGVDLNDVDKNGVTAFMQATTTGNVDLVESLLPYVNDINQIDHKGMSALAHAVYNGSTDVVSLLIKNNADVQTIDESGNNLAYYLIQSYKPARSGQKNEFFDKMNILKLAGVKFNALQQDKNTLYHFAVSKNDINLLKSLDAFPIDINALNEDGMSALHRAALVATDDTILKYLLDKGAAKDLRTEFDETAFDLANENESLLENKISLEFLN